MLYKIGFILLLLSNISVSKNKTTTIAIAKSNAMAIAISQDTVTFTKQIDQAKKLYSENKFEEALPLFLQILEDAKLVNNINTQYSANRYISTILRKTHNLKKALFYASEALKFAEIKKDTSKIIYRNNIIATIYHDFYKKDTLKYNYAIDSMEQYTNNYIKYINTSDKYKKYNRLAYRHLSIIYFLKKEYKASENYILKSIKINQEQNNIEGEISNINILANNYIQIKNYRKANDYYLSALDLLNNNNINSQIGLKQGLYTNLAWTNYKLKNYTAYNFLAKANRIKDSLQSIEFDTAIAEGELKYNVDIAKKEAEEKRIIEVQKKERMQAWSIALGLLLLGTGITFWNYSINSKLKRKNITLQFSKTRLLKEKEIERLENETQIKILNATLDGKEAERKQIAETLHDSVSALLSAANLHLQASKSQYKGETPIEIDKTQVIIDEASIKIRKLSHELISSVLLKFGLAHAIQNFCEKYSNSQIDISCISRNMARYDQSFEIKINNIIEEFINNILKHSQAHQAFVSIQEQDQKLLIRIQDDGVGFDTKNIPKSDGIGLNQISARIKMMKGSLNIESEINEGTSIQIEVPVIYKNYN